MAFSLHASVKRAEKRCKSGKEVSGGALSQYLLSDCFCKNPFQSESDSKLPLTGKVLKVSEKDCSTLERCKQTNSCMCCACIILSIPLICNDCRVFLVLKEMVFSTLHMDLPLNSVSAPICQGFQCTQPSPESIPCLVNLRHTCAFTDSANKKCFSVSLYPFCSSCSKPPFGLILGAHI